MPNLGNCFFDGHALPCGLPGRASAGLTLLGPENVRAQLDKPSKCALRDMSLMGLQGHIEHLILYKHAEGLGLCHVHTSITLFGSKFNSRLELTSFRCIFYVLIFYPFLPVNKTFFFTIGGHRIE